MLEIVLLIVFAPIALCFVVLAIYGVFYAAVWILCSPFLLLRAIYYAIAGDPQDKNPLYNMTSKREPGPYKVTE